MVLDLMAQLDREASERNKIEALLRELLPERETRVYVDHAGRGGKAALEWYKEALVKAGFTVEYAKKSEYQKKLFLWVR